MAEALGVTVGAVYKWEAAFGDKDKAGGYMKAAYSPAKQFDACLFETVGGEILAKEIGRQINVFGGRIKSNM